VLIPHMMAMGFVATFTSCGEKKHLPDGWECKSMTVSLVQGFAITLLKS